MVKYRKKMVKTARGNWVDHHEPYNDEEKIWHTTSGTKGFANSLLVPGADGFSEAQLAAVTKAFRGKAGNHGLPSPDEMFAEVSPSINHGAAWTKFHCDVKIKSRAIAECKGCVERLKDVSAVATSKEFTLVYFPVAVVSYEMNRHRFRHYVSLLDGNFSGDIPLDEEAVKNEMLRTAKQQGFQRLS